jgi:hypothetical protein
MEVQLNGLHQILVYQKGTRAFSVWLEIFGRDYWNMWVFSPIFAIKELKPTIKC